jgi:RepB plasmid partitioning protein/ParB/Sulfiredoxin domain
MTARHIKTAFQPTILFLPLTSITPLKELNPQVRVTAKYKQIAASLKHLGLIEPLVVFQSGADSYWLLDGTLRFDILKTDTPDVEVRCLLATDDESYNYNKRVNYMPPIAEHNMILKALANGVTEERIAEALDVNVVAIRKKRDLLDGICEEAAELLKDKRVTADGFTVLRKMKPVRQIYAVEMMIASNNYSTRFARGLLAVTKPEGLVAPEDTYKRSRGTMARQRAVMEQGSDALIEDFKVVEKSYTSDLLSLTIAAGYLTRMLQNARIERHLLKLHPDILNAIQEILAAINKDKINASSNGLVVDEPIRPVSSSESADPIIVPEKSESSQCQPLDPPLAETGTLATTNSVEIAETPTG